MTATGLVHYDSMRRELALCSTTDEVKDVKDRARAAEIYAKQIHDKEAEKQLAGIRIRAEERLGQILKEMAEKGERRKQNDAGPGRGKNESPRVSRLSDLGVSANESSRCQQLASIPKETFERLMTEFESSDEVPSTQAILRAAELEKSVTYQTVIEQQEYDAKEFVFVTMPKAEEAAKPKAKPHLVIEGKQSEDAERVAREICDKLGAINELLAFSLPQRKAALESSYGPILYTEIAWLEQSAHTFLASAKEPTKKAIREARKTHPEYGDEA